MYAQLSYKQFVGTSHLGIDEAGCFVVADADLEEKVGIHDDPIALNKFYTDHKIYTYDLTDKANDDLTWSSITKRCPQLVVKQIGYSGWPDSDLAQVEFRYKNHLGQEVTHFCAVNHIADHSIIDSWDGKVKTPAEYEKYYGQPIAWATFVYHTPQTTPAGVHNAPVSAPAAHTSTPQPVPQAPTKLYLPPSVWTWHIYKPEGPYTLPYALKNVLSPKRYGGLTYDIIGNPAPHIYLIQTKNFGKVAIYAGPDTVAQFPGTGHGEGEDTSMPVSEVVPAPTPSPSIAYARFETSMQLVTNKDTHAINFESGNTASDLPQGTPFEAVGKATLPNGDVYFMDSNSFGIAEQTQRTPIMVGVKTVDLSPAPQQAGITYNIVTPPGTVTTPLHNEPAFEPPAAVKTARPWQETFMPIVKGDSKENPTPIDYKVREDMLVYDLATGNDRREVKQDTRVPIIGEFIFGGSRYYLAQSSFKNGTWYGFPVASLRRQNAHNTSYQTNDDINQLDTEIETITKTEHAKPQAGGFFARFKRQRSN
jgi:hypothetical protein